MDQYETTNPLSDERPLYNAEAEISALGTMLLDDNAAKGIASLLKPGYFFRPAHKIMFKTLRDMVADGESIDFVTFRERLGSNLSEIGGENYILTVAEYTPSAANWLHYAKIVKEKWLLRSTRRKCEKLMWMIANPEVGIDQVAATAAALPMEMTTDGWVSPWKHVKDVNLSTMDAYGLSTGLPRLDAMIGTKGFPSGQMTVVRAYHKSGKTAFMLQSAAAACEMFESVGYATFADLNAEQILRRLLKGETGWAKLPDQPELGVETRLDQIKNDWDLRIYDSASSGADGTIEAFAAWVQTEHEKRPFDRLYVDYAQEIRSNDQKADTMINEQGIIAAKMNPLARQLGIPFIVGSQITEGFQGSRAKTKYGRAWEEKAGWVLTLDRKVDEATGKQTINVESTFSRFGPSDISETFEWDDEKIRLIP